MAPANSVSRVGGSWTVPAVSCPTGSSAEVAIWVGIEDGSTIEQVGTLASCGSPIVYEAVYYMGTGGAGTGTASVWGSINAGDTVFVNESFSGSTSRFSSSLHDAMLTGAPFSASASVAGATRTSAEWIVEAPSTGCPSCTLLKLANFGALSFLNGRATISGVNSGIASYGPATLDQIFMVRFSNSNFAKASVAPIVSGGSGFTVTWRSAGP